MKLFKCAISITFSFIIIFSCKAQTNYGQNQPAIGLGVVQPTGFPYTFTFEGKKVGHYALGWYEDPLHIGAPMAYLSGYGGIRFFLGGSTRVFFSTAGNVGIGTTTPAERLSVNGNIRAKEVKVEMANWPDYVFQKDYALLPLDNLNAYIKESGHLPGIPTAKEVESDGVALAEMNRKLLEKVEELTLYLIEINETNRQIKEKNELLENRVSQLENPK